jgi:hypothetical protein
LVLGTGNLNPFYASNGIGIGTYTAEMQNLVPNNTYYVRSYAKTSTGTYFSNQITFTTNAVSGLAIGQTYAGGIVFYIDSTGQHGLICAPSDIGLFPFGCGGTCFSTPTTVGTGAQNSATIVSMCAQQNSAALACDQYVINGYSDWYLPSYNELKLIWQNLILNNISASLVLNNYWSSSDLGMDGGCEGVAWALHFGIGSANFGWGKDTPFNTRAIRSF